MAQSASWKRKLMNQTEYCKSALAWHSFAVGLFRAKVGSQLAMKVTFVLLWICHEYDDLKK